MNLNQLTAPDILGYLAKANLTPEQFKEALGEMQFALLTPPQAKLLAYQASLDPNSIKRLRQGSMRFQDATYFCKVWIDSSSGQFKVVLPQDDEQQGLKNFNKDILDPSFNLSVTHLALGYGKQVGGQAPTQRYSTANALVNYTNNMYQTNPANITLQTPAVLLNADFELNVGQLEVTTRTVSEFFVNGTGSQSTNPIDQWVAQDTMPIVASGSKILPVINFASGAQLPTQESLVLTPGGEPTLTNVYHFLYFAMKGIRTMPVG